MYSPSTNFLVKRRIPVSLHSAFQQQQLEQEMSRLNADTEQSDSFAAGSTAQSAILTSVANDATASMPLIDLDVPGTSVAASADEPFKQLLNNDVITTDADDDHDAVVDYQPSTTDAAPSTSENQGVTTSERDVVTTEQPNPAYTSVAAASTSGETVTADKTSSSTSMSVVETPAAEVNTSAGEPQEPTTNTVDTTSILPTTTREQEAAPTTTTSDTMSDIEPSTPPPEASDVVIDCTKKTEIHFVFKCSLSSKCVL